MEKAATIGNDLPDTDRQTRARRRTGVMRAIIVLTVLLLCAASLLGISLADAKPGSPTSAVSKTNTLQQIIGGVKSKINEQTGQSCPPATINGNIGKGSTDYPSTSGVQTGRVSQNGVNSSCAAPKSCPGISSGGLTFAFDAYEFVNDSASDACVTFTFPESCAPNQAIHPVAYLGSFDPANPCTNYLGDFGNSINANDAGAFSVTIPANASIVLVVHEIGTTPDCSYSFSVSGLPCIPPCPPPTITGDIGQGSGDYPSTSGVQTGRVSQNGVNSSCAAPKSCPGISSGGLTFAFDAYEFVNDSASDACVTFTFPESCGVNQAIHPVAYLGSFDPANPCTNYLGDFGNSINANDAGAFSVTIPANASIVLVVHEIGTTPDCSYSFSVSGLPCQTGGGGCTLTCPADVTQGNDAGMCGAIVNYAPPTSSGTCGTISCAPPSGSFFAIGATTVTCSDNGSSANCSFTVTVNDTEVASLICPANITQSTTADQCSAVINYASPTASDNCSVSAVVCNPPSGSTFPQGVTTVTCGATEAGGNVLSCSFTITVVDTQPPAISCAANLTAVTPQNGCGAVSCVVVNFPAPVVTDNCVDATVICNPPSGACLPAGVTTVTCTATDAAGNTATCSFTVTVFDVCIQDENNPATTLLFNSLTGEYRFCCGGTTYTGSGTVTVKGCTISLQHNTSQRRVSASVDKSLFRGSASLQSPPGSLKCVISDRDTRNNACLCQ